MTSERGDRVTHPAAGHRLPHEAWGITAEELGFICRLSSDPFPTRRITVFGRVLRAESHIVIDILTVGVGQM